VTGLTVRDLDQASCVDATRTEAARKPLEFRSRFRPSRSPVVNAMLLALALLIAGTLIALVKFWPHGQIAHPNSLVIARSQGAVVDSVRETSCTTSLNGRCRIVTARIRDGRGKGTRTSFEIVPAPGLAGLKSGDAIRLIRNPPPPQGATTKRPAYSYSDFDRRGPMLWLGVGFVVLLLVSGRMHGLRALVGLCASLMLVLKFVIPSILEGNSAVGVALTGSLAVLLVTIPLCYGVRAKAISAWLGTALSLFLAVELASAFTHLAHLSGASSEEATLLSASDSKISLQGLLLGGMVIGALGVLIDLTVSQSSTVIALRRANPALRFRRLFKGALEVGHDHIAATVNTLVFAYAGASLPVLLIFSIGGTSFTDAVNSEAVAVEVIATLVGSIGLIASMPITTALAALLATRMSDKEVALEHTHAH
jgi:uncharacterized membrane protein